MYRLMIDTNILLDSLIQGRPDEDGARELFDWCTWSGDMGMVTPSSLNDTYYLLRKRMAEPYARKAIQSLMELLVIAPLSWEECSVSITSDEPDFEDGLVRAAAELNDADFIITRDERAFKNSKLKCMTASEYLAWAKAQDKRHSDF
ncbi:MAG: PIN domain-containing protein [Atopobiaceae bacterium]|nr:PIN domain-containing protein [Atopobiaceae bacterium]